MPSDSTPPYWQLLSVLFSTFPLSPSLAMTLYEAAFELHSTDTAATKVAGDVATGTLRNLRKHALIGTIGGPTFEAELETAHGKSMVRFLLTRQGLESRGVLDVPKHLRN
jgi:hypothetical protein